MQNVITQYITEINRIYKAGNATEHSYRPALKCLLEKMTNGLTITNEPKRIACGAPDYIVTLKEIPIGYIEAKDVGIDLNSKTNKAQFDRYKQSLDNLIITDYLNFQLFEGENLVTEVAIGKSLSNKIEPIPENFNTFVEVIKTFSLYNGKAIKDSQELAEFMAAKTQLLAEVIEKSITDTDENNSLRQQLNGFKQVLLPTMTDAQFADIYAQTVAYGMFVARLQDFSNDKFTRQHAATLIPQSNPFLRNLFKYIAGFDLDENIRWIVDAISDMFNYVDITSIHNEFVSKDKDPFLHFYEDFLAKYDKNLKTAMGAYYTPLPVVKFIVNAVDDILKTDFDISTGLADNSTIRHSAAFDAKSPENKSLNKRIVAQVCNNGKEVHRVQILDPATGTGTFLAEVVRKIYKQFENNAGMWNDYVQRHLIPRLNGFEIMMSPYTMAHLKMNMILQKLGATISTDRLHIYLTDALESPKQNIQQIPFAQWLSNEANEAAKIKNDVPVMVVLGNPPYSGESSNNGDWIMNRIAQYKKEPQNPSINIPDTKWINNDYVKFIRFGQHFIEKNGEGILAYITDNSFLDSLSFRGMRYNLMQTFDKIYIFNLHGNSLKKETAPDSSKDENVFDIMQGVSINIFVKAKNTQNTVRIFYCDLYGKRQEKYSFLLDSNLQTVEWKELQPQMPNCFFVPKDFSLQEEYEKGFKIDELFNLNGVGICSKRDEFTIHETKEKLMNTIKEFVSLNDEEEARSRFNLGKDTDWKLSAAKKDLTNNPDFSKIAKLNYRPFDIRYTYHSNNKGFHARPVYEIMQHFTKRENIGLVVGKQNFNEWKHAFVTKEIADLHLIDMVTSIFPLYRYIESFGKLEKVANLNAATITRFQNDLQLTVPLVPEQIFDYIYAVLHSPAYRERYKEFLKIDFPRIPYPENAGQFWRMVELGGKLRRLHLMEDVEPQEGMADYPVAGSNVVEKLRYVDDKVYINDTQYFDHVPPKAWNFYIGGYQPAQKRLKDRKGRVLNYEDIRHYQKIIRVLKKTRGVMQEVDSIIEK